MIKQTYTNRYFNWGMLILLILYFFLFGYMAIIILEVNALSFYNFLNNSLVPLVLAGVAATTLLLPKVKAEKYVLLWWTYTFLEPLYEFLLRDFIVIFEDYRVTLTRSGIGLLIFAGLCFFSKDKKERRFFHLAWFMVALALCFAIDYVVLCVSTLLMYKSMDEHFAFSILKMVLHIVLISTMIVTGWLLHKQKLKQIPALVLFGALLVLYFFGGRIIGLIL